MSGFFLFSNIPHDIKKRIVRLSQSNMLGQFPWERVYKTKKYIIQDIFTKCLPCTRCCGARNTTVRNTETSPLKTR